MSCFSFPIIKVRGCDETGSSAYFLQDLHALSFDNIADFADAERGTALQLIRDKEKVAADEVIDDYLSMLKQKMNISEVLGTSKIGAFGSLTDDVDYERISIQLDCMQRASFGYNTALYIRYYSQTDTSITVYVTEGARPDALVGGTLVAVTTGINIIPINQVIESDTVTIDITGTGTIGIKPNDCACVSNCCEWNITNTITVGGEDSVVSCFGGVEVHVDTRFDRCEVVRRLGGLLDKLIWYKLGIVLLDDWLTSNEGNILTVNGRIQADRAKILYTGGKDPQTEEYSKGKYPKALKQIVDGTYHMFSGTGVIESAIIQTENAF